MDETAGVAHTTKPGRPIRLIVIDDHPLFRQGVHRALGEDSRFDIVGEAAKGVDGLDKIRSLRPDLALVDLQLPDLDGIAITETIMNEGLPTHVAIVSAYEDSSSVYAALASGAKAYLPKTLSGSDLCDALASVAAGGTVIPAGLQQAVAQEIRLRRGQADAGPALSARELDVLKLAADGFTSQQIAERLYLSPTTVKTHLRHTFEKLDAPDRAAAVAAAIRRGLIT